MLFLIIITGVVLLNIINVESGANNLHMLDGISTQDIIAGDVFFEITDPIELEYTYRLRPAKNFGAPFNASIKLTGVPLVPTVPATACSIPKNAAQLKGNVALVERGECSFLSKTIIVESCGAKAIIITERLTHQSIIDEYTEDNEINVSTAESGDYEFYIEMVHDNTSRDAHIPSGFLLGRNGRAIRATLQRLKRKYALINLPLNLTFTPPHMINHPPWLDSNF